MRPKTMVAILLLAVGVVALAYQGISYTTREKTLDLGPLQVTTEKTNRIPLPPIVGAVAVVGGLVLLVVDSKRSSRAAA